MEPFDPKVRKLFWLAYLAAGLMLVDQVIEIAVALLGSNPTPGLASWRYGAFGLIAGRLGFLIVADAFLFAAATSLDHRIFLRILGFVHLAMAVVLFGALLLFGLDAIEMHGRARSAMSGLLNLATLRAGGVSAIAIALFTWAGIATIRMTRKHRRRGESRGSAPVISR